MIELRIRKRLFTAHGDISLEVDERIERGEMLAVFGESGVGKTTLLRILAGLDRPDEGRIVVDGEVWFDGRTSLPVHRRSLGFVFQEPALFPNMTVRENLAYGFRGDEKWLDHLLRETDLTRLADRKPSQLSGGQAQRVALARAVARRPAVLLLDEPLSSLDASMRVRLQQLVRTLHRELGMTGILVSHDVGDVVRVADRVLVVRNGRVAAKGPPLEVFAGDRTTGEPAIPAEVLRIDAAARVLHVLVNDRVVRLPFGDGESADDVRIGGSILLSPGNSFVR